MLKVITIEVPIEEELKERIQFACKYSNVKCIIKNGFIHSIDRTNLNYIEPNKIIIKNTLFFAFNHSRDIFVNNVEQNENSTFTLSEKQMVRFIELTGEVQNMEEQFDKLKEIYVNISNIKDNIEYLHKRNNELIKNNDLLADKNDKLEKKVKHLEGSEYFLKSYLKKEIEDRLEIITYLCKYANSKDLETSRFVK